MENTHRFLPERKNRGSRMSELAKDEGKMLDDDKYSIFKEDSNDDDFNPDDIKKEKNSSSDYENEEEEEEEDDEEGEEEEDDINEEEESEKKEKEKKKKKDKKKNEEEILDIEQLDIDKIDMIEDLRDKGIDIDDEEELERRLKEYNEESEYEESEDIKKKVIKKKKILKKKGHKKKLENVDDNIFLNNQNEEENKNQNENENKEQISNLEQNNQNEENNNANKNAEFTNGKIIISNPEFDENSMQLEEELQSQSKSKSALEQESETKKKKTKKVLKKNKIKINLLSENEHEQDSIYNPIISINDFNIIINKNCLTENLFPQGHPNLEYIELNKHTDLSDNTGKANKNKLQKYKNKNIISINYHNIVINKSIDKDYFSNKKEKEKELLEKNNINNNNINNKIINDDINSINDNTNLNNDLIGHKRTRSVNNLIELFKKQKKEKINKNVTIVGNRDNPKYIYISKKIYNENDEEKEIQKEEKKKKKKDKEKNKDIEIIEEQINFDLEQEIDTKNIIKKYKQQEKDKKQFGIQNKVISQEQRLLESIFTELTNKQSLKSMQKLEDLNKREYTYSSRKILKDSIKIINSERHILEEEKNKTEENNHINTNKEDKKEEENKDNKKKEEIIEVKIIETKKNEVINLNKNKNININDKEKNIKENKKEDMNISKEEKEKKEKEEKEKKEQEEKAKKEEEYKKLIDEYKQKEKKLNKMTVTFANKEYYRTLFSNFNKKPQKEKKEKICIITGNPAKYFDPLTKNYYSTIEAFKILRERYFQKEEDCLLFKIQTLSDLASQKKERLKKMIMQESEKPQIDYGINNPDSNINLNINMTNKKTNSIKIDSETMTIEDQDDNTENNKLGGINSTLLKMIDKFGLLRKDGGNDEKKVISHRIYNRNRENCVESGMLLEANKYKLIISKKIFKDKYSSKLPSTNEVNSSNINTNANNEK